MKDKVRSFFCFSGKQAVFLIMIFSPMAVIFPKEITCIKAEKMILYIIMNKKGRTRLCLKVYLTPVTGN